MKDSMRIAIIFSVIVTLKIILSAFVPAPSMFSDEYVYAKQAQNFIENGNLLVHGLKPAYPFMYSVMISPAYLFSKNMEIIYFFMKVINALISSLIIIPIWLLAKEFLDSKKAVYAALLSAVYPALFSFPAFIMAENLFYPLFILSIYLVYKSLKSESRFMSIISGVCIAATVFAKYSALMLFAMPAIFYCINIFLTRKFWKPKQLVSLAIIYLSAAAFIAIFSSIDPSFGLSFIASPSGDATAVLRHKSFFPSFANWILIYAGFLAIASGIVFWATGIIALKEKELNKKAFILFLWAVISITIIVAANHSAGGPVAYGPFSLFTERPVGRYVDAVVPLLFILGIMGFENYVYFARKKLLNAILIGTSLLMMVASQLNFAPLLPVNNLSLSHFGVLKILLEKIVHTGNSEFNMLVFGILAMAFILMPIIFIFINRHKPFNLPKAVAILSIYFLAVGSLSYGITAINARQYWYNGEQMELGVWAGKNLDPDIPLIIDNQSCKQTILKTDQQGLCDATHIFSPFGFFIKNDISVKEIGKGIKNEYIITNRNIEYPNLIKSTEHFFIYGTNKPI